MAESKALEKLQKARCSLMLDTNGNAFFFSTLAMRLKLVEARGVGTMATDGKHLFYEPVFVEKLAQPHVVGVIIHEVMHCVMLHHTRMQDRDAQLWNVAADLAVNCLIKKAGYQLPSGALLPGERSMNDDGSEFHSELTVWMQSLESHLSAEEYYKLIPAQLQKASRRGSGEGQGQGQGKGQGQGDGSTGKVNGQDVHDVGSCGGMIKPGKGETTELAESEGDWKVAAVRAANEARSRGSFSSDVGRVVEQTVHQKVPWREVLRNFMTAKRRDDYTWQTPNRRHVADGLYLPSLRSEGMGTVVVVLDTSGSISRAEAEKFVGEVGSLVEAVCPGRMHVMAHHTDVYMHDTWEPSDGKYECSKFQSGGTSHVDVFKKIDELDEVPEVVICMTDLCTEFPDDHPAYPVFWGRVGDYEVTVPFGTMLELD